MFPKNVVHVVYKRGIQDRILSVKCISPWNPNTRKNNFFIQPAQYAIVEYLFRTRTTVYMSDVGSAFELF